MIYVCDAIMGAGKSSAAINHINQSEEKWLYCTPYLTEVQRVKEGCGARHFKEPQSNQSGIGGKKKSLIGLMREGNNVATTHAMFGQMDRGIISLARDGDYSLVIDEAYDVIQTTGLHSDDVTLSIDNGFIENRNGRLFVTEAGREYKGFVFRDLINTISENTIVMDKDQRCSCLLYPPDAFEVFKDVYVLTYLFDGSLMQNYFDMYGLEYKRIGVRNVDGVYEFFDGETVMPEYISTIRDKIHICDEAKLNAIGSKRTALSRTWFDTHFKDGDVAELKRHHRTFMRRCGIDHGEHVLNMWTTYKDYEGFMRQCNSKRGFVPLSTKATNIYANKKNLAFMANIFYDPGLKITLNGMGIKVDEDNYALSSLIQWIWRSAIRNGEDINLYIPSKRMRELFIGWMDSLSE